MQSFLKCSCKAMDNATLRELSDSDIFLDDFRLIRMSLAAVNDQSLAKRIREIKMRAKDFFLFCDDFLSRKIFRQMEIIESTFSNRDAFRMLRKFEIIGRIKCFLSCFYICRFRRLVRIIKRLRVQVAWMYSDGSPHAFVRFSGFDRLTARILLRADRDYKNAGVERAADHRFPIILVGVEVYVAVGIHQGH